MGRTTRKLAGLGIFSSVSASLSAAQVTGSGSSVSEEQFIELFNQILFTFEADTIADVFLFFILPIFGYYFINKNIFSVAFENFHERIGREEWRRTDDELPTGVKGLSLVVAFMTVQITGIFGTALLFITAVLASAAWSLSYFDLLQTERDQTDIQEAEQDAEEADAELTQADHESHDAAETENDEEARHAQRRLEIALKDLSEAETDLEEFMQRDWEDLEELKREAREFLEQERNGTGMKDFGPRSEQLQEELSKLRQKVEDGVEEQKAKIYFDENIGPQFMNLYDDINRMNQILKNVESAQEDEFNRLAMAVNDYRKAKDVSNRVKREIGNAESEEEFIEKLSERLSDPQLENEAEQTEERIVRLASIHQEIKQSLNQQNNAIGEAVDIVKDQMNFGYLFDLSLSELQVLENEGIGNMKDNAREIRSQSYLEDEMEDVIEALGEMEEKIPRIIDENKHWENKLLDKFGDLKRFLRR